MKLGNLFSILFVFGIMGAYAQKVQSISEMRKVMVGEDLSAHLLWDTIPHQHLFGISPLGRIEGEITIIDGQIFVAKVDKKGNIVITNNWQEKAPFGVYTHVKAWQSFDFEANVNNEADLQNEVEKIAKAQGYDISQAFPFRIKGTFENVDFHIISKPKKEKTHNHELHDKAKKHFSLQNTQGEILGFYSQHHIGVFTHRGSFVHTHFIDDTHKNMGHIEGVKISQKVSLWLPAKE